MPALVEMVAFVQVNSICLKMVSFVQAKSVCHLSWRRVSLL